MSAEFEECDLRHVFQNGKWVLRRVTGSQASKYATITKRMFCYPNLPKCEAEKCKDIPGSSISAKPEVTETSKIMKRDILSKTCPWISTTHKDFYGQRYPKLTDRRTKLTSPRKIPEKDVTKLLSEVKHVPVIRMECYGEGDFISHYSHEFQDPGTRHSEPEQKDFDFTKSEAYFIPKVWMTTYEADYVNFAKPKSPRSLSPVITEDLDIPKEPLYQNEWTTSHQDYGSTGQRIHIYPIPYHEVHGIDSTKPSHIGPEIEIGQLMQTKTS